MLCVEESKGAKMNIERGKKKEEGKYKEGVPENLITVCLVHWRKREKQTRKGEEEKRKEKRRGSKILNKKKKKEKKRLFHFNFFIFSFVILYMS